MCSNCGSGWHGALAGNSTGIKAYQKEREECGQAKWKFLLPRGPLESTEIFSEKEGMKQ